MHTSNESQSTPQQDLGAKAAVPFRALTEAEVRHRQPPQSPALSAKTSENFDDRHLVTSVGEHCAFDERKNFGSADLFSA